MVIMILALATPRVVRCSALVPNLDLGSVMKCSRTFWTARHVKGMEGVRVGSVRGVRRWERSRSGSIM